MGASTTHVIPIIKGKVQYKSLKRLNVGGNNMLELITKNLLLRYPHLKYQIKNSFVIALMENYMRCAMDYPLQMQYFAKGKHAFKKR